MYIKHANDIWIDRLRKSVNGKRVIIVGNATSILNEKHGKFIDDFDVVMRFGRGEPLPVIRDYVGKNTNIWSFGALRAACWPMFKTPFKIFNLVQIPIYKKERYDFGIAKALMTEEFQVYRDYFLTGSLKDAQTLIADAYGKTELNEEMRMSQGVHMALWMIHKIKTFKELHIIGFDCMKSNFKFDHRESVDRFSSSWHLPLPVVGGIEGQIHSAQDDEQFLMDAESQGQLIWHRTDHTKMNSRLIDEIAKQFRPEAKNILQV